MTTTSMKDRVAALLARANDPAASEAEAETCMTKAMDLMQRFGFTMDDVTGDRAEPIGESNTPWTSGRPGGAMFYVQNAIAAFTNTRVSFRGAVSRGTSMTYYGYGPERDLALWLHGHILNAIKVQSANYDPGPYSTAVRSRDRKSFAIAMALRIARRLFDMAETLDASGRGTGTDVLVVKNQKLDEHFEVLGLPGYRRKKQKLFTEGVEAGRAAGDAVSLHRPVEQAASAQLQITQQ